MRVLITGAAGMLGRDVAAAARAGGHEVVALTRADLDVTDEQAVRRRIAAEAPETVVHCAAWTDVDGAEADHEGAMRLNGEATGHVAAAAAGAGASVVVPSTDYVFDGLGRRPYVESDPVGPRSVYGHSKLEGERMAASANPRHFVARTSWLFGVGGGNFVETMLRVGGERGELRVVQDQVGCPTYTAHLALALLELAATDAYGVHHVAGTGSCSWYEFAVTIFQESGVSCRVEPCASAEFPRPAPRPAYSVLGTERGAVDPLPAWRDGLSAYLAERRVAA